MINKIALKGFTAFKELEFNPSPGVNILIGRNGTGKTHLMKIAYSVLSAVKDGRRLEEKIAGVFLPVSNSLGRLVRRKPGWRQANIEIWRNNGILEFVFSTKSSDPVSFNNEWKGKIESVVYIPAKEFLSHAPGFRSLMRDKQIHFEETYDDLLAKAYLPISRGPISPEKKLLLNLLQKEMEGKIIAKGEAFYSKSRQGELEFSLLSEGVRKLGLLCVLIHNESLLNGATLFGDEPEANLHPKVQGTVIDLLLHLQRRKSQIFLATHDYSLLKEFDLRAQSKDAVMYHSLYYNGDKELAIDSKKKLHEVHPNTIIETYSDMFDRDVRRALKGRSMDD